MEISTPKKVGNNNNVMIARKAIQGNSKAHSLSVLKRKAPELFQAGRRWRTKAREPNRIIVTM
jgi:hypothetical protein